MTKFCVIFTIATSLFISTSQVVIKMFFKFNKNVVKQRYKSIVSFKRLRIILGLFWIISFYIGLSFLKDFVPNPQRFRFLANPAPFIISLIGNLILLVLLTRNDDAFIFLIFKIRSFKEKWLLDFERRKFLMKMRRNKIFPATMTPLPADPSEIMLEEIQNECVVEMEDVVPVVDET